jgi:hypothetical protein
MANFTLKGTPISKQRISALKNHTLTIGLWGPINTYVSPPAELDVVVNPSSRNYAVARSKKPITGSIREWTIKGTVTGSVTVEAKAGSDVWDSFDLDILPASYANLTPAKRKFIDDLAREGDEVARRYGFPLSAMLACACWESGFGTSTIYKRTGNPFNLQKPAGFQYPKCQTEGNRTINKEDEKSKVSPFCIATSLSDAARMFCEWIAYYPNGSGSQQLRAVANKPKQFASDLYKVGFANSESGATLKFGELWEKYELGRFD